MINNYKFSQDYEIIPPQKQRSYPISIKEWELIKKKINDVKNQANYWHDIGLLLIGAALTTFITIFITDFTSNLHLLVCWFIFFLTSISGGLAFFFGSQSQKIQNKTKEDVIEFMNTIQDRFKESEEILDQINDKIIKILSAKYGAKDQFKDVTSKIQEYVSKGITEIKVSNALVEGNDPIVGVKKYLEIEYIIDEIKKTNSEVEGKKIKIE